MPGSPGGWAEAAGAQALDAGLRALHGSGRAGELSALHERAAGLMATPEARRFHLTQAWVFAMEAGDEAAVARLEPILKSLGGLPG